MNKKKGPAPPAHCRGDGAVKKASLEAFPLRMVEVELRPVPSKGWAEMIRKVYEVDPLFCPECTSDYYCFS